MLAASVTPSAIEDGFATRRSAYLRSDAASLSRIKSGPARTGCATKAALVLFSGDAKQRRPRRPPEHARGNTLSHCSGGRRRGGAVDVSRRSWSGDRSVTTAPPDWIATLPASLADIGRSVLFGHGVGVAGCGRPAPSAARRTACESCGDKEAPVTRKRPLCPSRIRPSTGRLHVRSARCGPHRGNGPRPPPRAARPSSGRCADRRRRSAAYGCGADHHTRGVRPHSRSTSRDLAPRQSLSGSATVTTNSCPGQASEAKPTT